MIQTSITHQSSSRQRASSLSKPSKNFLRPVGRSMKIQSDGRETSHANHQRRARVPAGGLPARRGERTGDGGGPSEFAGRAEGSDGSYRRGRHAREGSYLGPRRG